MKVNTFFAVAISIFAFSCSSDDEPGSTVTLGNYMPLTDGNFWTYDVDGTQSMGRDSVYVANDTVISGTTYKKIKARPIPFGMYSGTTQNNGLRIENGKIMMTGNASVGINDMLPLGLSISNFVLLDENASANQELGSISGTSQQEIGGYPMTLNYTLKSIAGSSLPTYTTPENAVYDDVKSVTIKLNLAITATVEVLGMTMEVPVLIAQDVVTSERFYANDIGMVYAETVISYELQDFSAFDITLPIPQSDTQLQIESLQAYNID
ncbi:MAG: hypothetical protein ITG00_10140 [Flavobacterium sp.]|nr:hypothetical protein [Flavobacterium sp.]